MRTAPRAVSTNGSCSSFYPSTVLLRSLTSSVSPLLVRPRKAVTTASRQRTKYAKQRTLRDLHPDCAPKQEHFRRKVVHFFEKLLCFRRKAVEFFFCLRPIPIPNAPPSCAPLAILNRKKRACRCFSGTKRGKNTTGKRFFGAKICSFEFSS